LLNSAKHPAAALQSGGVCGILVLLFVTAEQRIVNKE
jgi:hypothetical protein